MGEVQRAESPDPFGDGLHVTKILMPDSLHWELEMRARMKDLQMTEYMRRSVSLMSYLEDVVAQGAQIQIHWPEMDVTEDFEL